MIRKLVLAAGLILTGTASWWLAKACAPDFLVAVFSYVRHPDLPRTAFIDGRLGVLQPTFARSYLVIAYRYLNGIGLNTREREQARDYYKDRQTGFWDHTGTDWAAEWRRVRSTIRNPPAPAATLITRGQLAYDPETHSFALNCAEDAFRTAVHTLEARRRQFGAGSTVFRSWMQAQDSVFENCIGEGPKTPEAAPAGFPALIRADRAYQIAAAHFYARQYDAALDGFRRIANDRNSPWSAISRYLVVRTLMRMTEEKKAGAVAKLNQEANSILADSRLVPIQGMTWNLVERAGIRERSRDYFRELARLVSSRGQDDGFREELWNYTDLYDHVIGDADPNRLVFGAPAAADASLFRDADLSDWIFCIQARDASVFRHSLTRWKQTRSPAWLLAALSHASGRTARDAGLVDAAEAVSETSPAFLTAQFHLFRFYEELGKTPTARESLSKILESPALKDLPSSTNLFRGLRMLAAPGLDDFLRFAGRKPVRITYQMNIGENPTVFADPPDAVTRKAAELLDHDATRVLNQFVPFRLLREAALGGSLPEDLRSEALMTAFTRGLMLGQDLTDFAQAMATSAPDIAPLAEGYLSEATDQGRRFAAAYLILRRPEARPYFGTGVTRQTAPGKLDDYRDNWWCPMDIPIELDSLATFHYWSDRTPNLPQRSTNDIVPEFLSGDELAEARAEFARLGKLNAATDFLATIVFPYADSHRGDPRVPEALHNLVRSGHYGCADDNTWEVTHAAFRILHQRYPQNEWTRRTPTWFRNDLDIRQELRSEQGRIP